MSDRLPQLRADWGPKWAKYVRTENDERAALAGYTVQEPLGEHVCRFFSKGLRHSKGEWAGQPFILAEYQRRDIIMPLFSWVRPDGRRRFTLAEIWIPKKHGKSAIGSGLSLYMLYADDEPGAEIYNLANDRSQAKIVFDEAANMVDASPEMRVRLEVVRSQKMIRKDGASWIQVLSSEHASAEGKNAHFWTIDEIHAFNERARMLREAMRYAGAARRQPMEVVISTAGDDIGPGRDEYDFADSVRKGKSGGGITDLHTFVFIAEAGPKDDHGDPAVWKKANPGLGVTLRLDDLAAEYEKARQTPRLMNSFKRYRLNIWTGSETPWLDVERWKACAATLDDDELKGLPCCAGLDLSSTTDLSAWVLAWKRKDGTYIIRPHFWLPTANIIEREREDRADYRNWAQDGWIELCDGDEIDQLAIEARIVEDFRRWNISEIGFDRYQAKLLKQNLERTKGIKKEQLLEIEQSTNGMGFGSQKLDDAIKSGRVVHDGNPIMARMVDKVRAYTDTNGNVRPVKCDANKRRVRIDGVVAAVMAIGRVELVKPRSKGLTLTRIL